MPDAMIGREEDLAWIEQTAGDLLIVGNPGCGKTYLHQYLAAKGSCLFAVDDDPTRLADAIREQQPSVIVVDDAHIRNELLNTLRRLRHELGATFAIHANCWPGRESVVKYTMNLEPASIRLLEPVTRETILQIIEHSGICGPDSLLHLLIFQSDGKPGLTAALIDACKRGGIDRVWSGEELATVLLGNSQLIASDRDRDVRASFAIGGDPLYTQMRKHSEQYIRLFPLNRMVDQLWERRALVAIENGVTPEELACHCTPTHWGGFGPFWKHFESAMPAYEALASHSDARLRVAGARGLAYVKRNLETEKRNAHREASRGFG